MWPDSVYMVRDETKVNALMVASRHQRRSGSMVRGLHAAA